MLESGEENKIQILLIRSCEGFNLMRQTDRHKEDLAELFSEGFFLPIFCHLSFDNHIFKSLIQMLNSAMEPCGMPLNSFHSSIDKHFWDMII